MTLKREHRPSILNFLLLMTCFLFFVSCSEDKPNEPESESPTDTDYSLISTKTIGSEGGTIEAEELILNIPSSSFSSTYEIKILSSDTDRPFNEQHISKTYKIAGLPIVYMVPLEISIKYSDVSNTHSLVLGQEIFVEGEIRTTYSHIDAIDTNNVLICNLPVPQNNNLLGKLSDENERDLIILMVNSLPYITPQSHFSITSPIYTEVNSIITLGDYLEEAYKKVLTLGLNYSERTNWPVKVLVRDLGNEVDAYTSCSWFGNNYGYLEFNTSLMNNLNDLRLTAGHEFFHLIQYLYDTRSGITKSGWASMHHWVNEATAAWFEEKFSEESNFISSNIMGVSQYSLDGMQLSPYDNNGNKIENLMSKCYGRGPIIKYLVERYGEENIIANIFNDIKSGRHPVEAVCQYDPRDWWDDFNRQLVTGNVYNKIPDSEWIGSSIRSSIFQINSENDLNHNFTSDYKDLSSKILFVRLAFPEISSESKAIFKISGAEKRNVLLFSFDVPSKEASYIGSDNNEFTVNDLRTLTTNNKNLLAVVTNNRYTSPYTWNNEITLNVSIENNSESNDIEGYYYCRVNHHAVYDFLVEKTGSDGSFETETFTSIENGLSVPVYGDIKDQSFIGSNKEGSISTNVNISFDNNYKFIESLTCTHTIENNNEVGNFYDTLRVVNIPKDDGSDDIDCSIWGAGYCSSLQKADHTWSVTYIDGGVTYTKVRTTTDVNCNDVSGIHVTFIKQSGK